MSGGEQQMLAIVRALMCRPNLLLLDEPSLGLSPVIIKEVYDSIREIRSNGTTVLLVEQNAKKALEIAEQMTEKADMRRQILRPCKRPCRTESIPWRINC